MKDPLPELLTLKETAEYLRIPLPTVYYLVQQSELPAIQIAGRWRVKRSILDREFLDRPPSPRQLPSTGIPRFQANPATTANNNRLNQDAHSRLTMAGSTSIVKTPRWEPDPKPQKADNPPFPEANAPSPAQLALIMTPDSEMQKLFEATLMRASMGRIIVNNAEETLRFASNQPFKVVAIDADHLEGVDESWFRLLNAHQKYAHFVLLVSELKNESLSVLLETNPVVLVQKPIDQKSITQIFKHLGITLPPL